ncbi:MAG: MBL fold metallo-hydrolase [Actinobacteria bacterium]|nr:MBL fold metallo-hydrolase [Actinomycetota bacterium]
MLIKGFPAGSWSTNAYVVAAGPGEPAIIIDPGQDSIEGINEIIRAHRLAPAAVILTHGHIDHIWSVAPVSAQFAIPAMIHGKDRYRLADPAGSSFAAAREQLLAMTKGELELTEPSDVEVIEENKSLNIAGVDWESIHAPGHTEGSMVIKTQHSGDLIAFTGDVLFAGSIGRTDLPGGDARAMQESLARVILPLADDTLVYPGHGSDTTIGAERATNPFLSTGRGL